MYHFNPEISVVVPVYKAEMYLDFCVQSIINQTFSDFELILVDDGSPDRCPAMCDLWAAKDTRIRVVHQKNKGLSAARNVGTALAAGDFISFVDSDDFIEPDMLQDLLTVARKTDADIIVGQYCRDERYLTEKPGKREAAIFDGETQLDLLFSTQFARRTAIIANWGKLYRRELFEDIRFPEGRVYEDESTVHHFLSRSRRLAVLDYPYYHYIRRPNSVVTGRSLNSFLDKQLALLERTEMLQQTQFAGDCARYCYAYCVDFMTEMFQKNLTDAEEAMCMTFVDRLLSRQELFLDYIPWHAKICLRLLAAKNRTVLRWVAKHSFAPGRRTFLAIKERIYCKGRK